MSKSDHDDSELARPYRPTVLERFYKLVISKCELMCRTCGADAACFGAYEGDDHWDFSCDECCGHGCEDGQCHPVEDLPTKRNDRMSRAAFKRWQEMVAIRRQERERELSEMKRGPELGAKAGIAALQELMVVEDHNPLEHMRMVRGEGYTELNLEGERMRSVTMTEARVRFAEITKVVELGSERVAITRHGKIVAALISPADLNLLVAHDLREDHSDAMMILEPGGEE